MATFHFPPMRGRKNLAILYYDTTHHRMLALVLSYAFSRLVNGHSCEPIIVNRRQVGRDNPKFLDECPEQSLSVLDVFNVLSLHLVIRLSSVSDFSPKLAGMRGAFAKGALHDVSR
jgi:hypothetical protein